MYVRLLHLVLFLLPALLHFNSCAVSCCCKERRARPDPEAAVSAADAVGVVSIYFTGSPTSAQLHPMLEHTPRTHSDGMQEQQATQQLPQQVRQRWNSALPRALRQEAYAGSFFQYCYESRGHHESLRGMGVGSGRVQLRRTTQARSRCAGASPSTRARRVAALSPAQITPTR